MRAFYDSANQVDSIFGSKAIILSNNRKNYLEIYRVLILGVSDTPIKVFPKLNWQTSWHFWFQKNYVETSQGPIFVSRVLFWFHSARDLFRFLSDRLFFRVLSDRFLSYVISALFSASP